jgi:hypothetical protein
MQLGGRWWNGTYGRLSRLDIWLWRDSNACRVQARKGDGDAPVWSKDYENEAYARAEIRRMQERTATEYGDEWKDITELYDAAGRSSPEWSR